MKPRPRYRCRYCGYDFPAALPVTHEPNGAMLQMSTTHRCEGCDDIPDMPVVAVSLDSPRPSAEHDMYDKPGAIIGISRAVMERALSLRADRDDAAVQEMVKRGLIVIVQGGVELRVDNLYESPVAVRKSGSPDVFYTYKIYLECPN
jgi:hypothetical protein